jgi:argininosuccinate lyase
LWCTTEVGYLRLGDGFVQASSIMPQKRNPVALEHARALASRALAQLQGLPLAVHNTPHGDIVDTEDDLQPLVASAFRDASRAIELVAAAMDAASFDVALMRRRAREHWVTITELADTLARDHGLPFTQGHAIAARVVRDAAASPGASLATLLATAAREVAGREVRLTDDELARVLSPEHFVEVRRTRGGPSPEVAARALEASRAALAGDAAGVARGRQALAAATARLADAVAAL